MYIYNTNSTIKEKNMLTLEEKAKRYDIIERGLQNRLIEIQKNLAFDLRCSVSSIPLEELEPVIEEEIMYFADELFADQSDTYFLIDYMVSENTPLSPCPYNPFQRKFLN